MTNRLLKVITADTILSPSGVTCAPFLAEVLKPDSREGQGRARVPYTFLFFIPHWLISSLFHKFVRSGRDEIASERIRRNQIKMDYL